MKKKKKVETYSIRIGVPLHCPNKWSKKNEKNGKGSDKKRAWNSLCLYSLHVSVCRILNVYALPVYIPDFCAFSFDALQLTESMESYTIPLTLRAKYMNETKRKRDTRKKLLMPGRNKITFFVLLHFRLRFFLFEMHVYNFLSEYPDTREKWITIFNVRFSFD